MCLLLVLFAMKTHTGIMSSPVPACGVQLGFFVEEPWGCDRSPSFTVRVVPVSLSTSKIFQHLRVIVLWTSWLQQDSTHPVTIFTCYWSRCFCLKACPCTIGTSSIRMLSSIRAYLQKSAMFVWVSLVKSRTQAINIHQPWFQSTMVPVLNFTMQPYQPCATPIAQCPHARQRDCCRPCKIHQGHIAKGFASWATEHLLSLTALQGATMATIQWQPAFCGLTGQHYYWYDHWAYPRLNLHDRQIHMYIIYIYIYTHYYIVHIFKDGTTYKGLYATNCSLLWGIITWNSIPTERRRPGSQMKIIWVADKIIC